MGKLIALRPILYLGRMYQAEEELPTNDPEMVSSWLKYNSAVWKEDLQKEVQEEKAEPVSVEPVSAEPGLEGQAVNAETQENLVGKVPKTARRKTK